MKKVIVAIKDELRGYDITEVADSEAVAYRSFYNAVNSTPVMKLNVKDYSLYQVGVFDTELGIIENCSPKLIVDAASCLRKEEK